MLKQLTTRHVNLFAFFFCCVLIAGVLYFEQVEGLLPCSLCIIQRLLIIFIGMVFLVAFIHCPKKLGQRIYGALTLIGSLAGAAVASRQLWLQYHPKPLTQCAPNLSYMLKELSFAEILTLLTTGTSDCSKIQWQFLHITMPGWALLWFLFFAGISVLLITWRIRQ